MNMDPRAAAQNIRGRMQHPSAEDRHTETFANQVLDELGMEHSALNTNMVVRALHEAGITPHRIAEYPKMVSVVRKDADGNPVLGANGKPVKDNVVVNNEDEEHDLRMKHDPLADLQQPSVGSATGVGIETGEANGEPGDDTGEASDKPETPAAPLKPARAVPRRVQT